ncbi:MAG TPA: hypothetical protein VIO61_08680 [Anaerolineaceae bacterium]
MNRLVVIGLVVIAVAAIAMGVAGYVYAQSPTPTDPGPGMMGGRGGRGGMAGAGMMANMAASTPLHDLMIAAQAGKLGLSADELNSKLAAGQTLWQIAQAKGWTAEQFSKAMQDAHVQALDEAVKKGLITKEQADWMKTRQTQMSGYSYGCFGDPAAPTTPNVTPRGRMGRWQVQPTPTK